MAASELAGPGSDASPREPVAPSAAGPIREAQRIDSIDAVRGFAILGIFLVNIGLFGQPIFHAMGFGASELPTLDIAAKNFVRVFGEFKFMSLFALLFGAGFVIQSHRARQAGRAFAGPYLRRMGLLLLIGLIHAWLFWYGDILVMYATIGVGLLIVRDVSGRALLILGLTVFLLGGLWMGGYNLLMSQFEMPMPEEITVDAALPAWDRFMAYFEASGYMTFSPMGAEAEIVAYQEGPWLAAFLARFSTWAGMMVFAVIIGGFGLRVVAQFLLGAALMKLGFFAPERRAWRKRAAIWGLAIGVPLEMASALWLVQAGETQGNMAIYQSVHFVWSLILMFGYLGLIGVLVDAGALRWLVTGLRAVGRMALSNYLLQTLVTTTIMYSYGFGQFGRWSPSAMVAYVFVFFAIQMVLSVLWLKAFRFGPLEWLWRAGTYWTLPKMRREAASPGASS